MPSPSDDPVPDAPAFCFLTPTVPPANAVGILGPMVFRFFCLSFLFDRSRSAKLMVRFSPSTLLRLLLFDDDDDDDDDDDETKEDPPNELLLLLLPLNEIKSPFSRAGAEARRSNVFKKLNFCFVLLLLLLLTEVVTDKVASKTPDADEEDEASADVDFVVVLGDR